MKRIDRLGVSLRGPRGPSEAGRVVIGVMGRPSRRPKRSWLARALCISFPQQAALLQLVTDSNLSTYHQ